jgi:hypothetical protein
MHTVLDKQVLDFQFPFKIFATLRNYENLSKTLVPTPYDFFCVRSYLDSLDAITILIKTQVQWPALEDQIRV